MSQTGEVLHHITEHTMHNKNLLWLKFSALQGYVFTYRAVELATEQMALYLLFYFSLLGKQNILNIQFSAKFYYIFPFLLFVVMLRKNHSPPAIPMFIFDKQQKISFLFIRFPRQTYHIHRSKWMIFYAQISYGNSSIGASIV